MGLAGWHGVTIFFVLSGFLITTLALREEEHRGRLNLRAFYIRRCFRLFPAYYAVLALYCVLILGLGIGAEKSEALLTLLPYYLLYLQEIPFFARDPNGASEMPFYQSWSLGIEEKFYLVWALLAFVALAPHRRARPWVTALLAVALAATPLLGQPGRFLFPYYPILVGCLCALLLHSPTGFQRFVQFGRPWPTVIVTLGFVALHLATARVDALDYLYPIAAAGLMVSVVVGDHGMTRLLQTRGLVFIGTTSYGIYLVHILCLNAVELVIPPGSGRISVSVLALFAASVVSIGVAYLLARTIERPLRDLGRRLSRGSPAKPVPP
jgi:peptidoglycan/LPS O-acetylase OafA/YrhL